MASKGDLQRNELTGQLGYPIHNSFGAPNNQPPRRDPKPSLTNPLENQPLMPQNNANPQQLIADRPCSLVNLNETMLERIIEDHGELSHPFNNDAPKMSCLAKNSKLGEGNQMF